MFTTLNNCKLIIIYIISLKQKTLLQQLGCVVRVSSVITLTNAYIFHVNLRRSFSVSLCFWCGTCEVIARTKITVRGAHIDFYPPPLSPQYIEYKTNNSKRKIKQ